MKASLLFPIFIVTSLLLCVSGRTSSRPHQDKSLPVQHGKSGKSLSLLYKCMQGQIPIERCRHILWMPPADDEHRAFGTLPNRQKRLLVSSAAFTNLVGYISSVLNIFNIYDNRLKACKYGGACAARDYNDLLLSILAEMNYQMSVIQDSLRQTNLRIDEFTNSKRRTGPSHSTRTSNHKAVLSTAAVPPY